MVEEWSCFPSAKAVISTTIPSSRRILPSDDHLPGALRGAVDQADPEELQELQLNKIGHSNKFEDLETIKWT